jgi:hypothetical protein
MLKFFVTVFRIWTIRLFGKYVTISEQDLELFDPKPDDGRPLKGIPDTATLYRRFQPHHFDASGDLVPAYFEFPGKKDENKSGQSFLIKGTALPLHALHRNCNDGDPLKAGQWEVFKLSVAIIPRTIVDPMQKAFYFKMIHTPYATCKAHCELFCSDTPDGSEYTIPGSVVRTKMRIRLSRKFRPTGIKVVVVSAAPGTSAV